MDTSISGHACMVSGGQHSSGNKMCLMLNLRINNQTTKECMLLHILNVVLLVVIIQKGYIESKHQLVKKYQVTHQGYEW